MGITYELLLPMDDPRCLALKVALKQGSRARKAALARVLPRRLRYAFHMLTGYAGVRVGVPVEGGVDTLQALARCVAHFVRTQTLAPVVQSLGPGFAALPTQVRTLTDVTASDAKEVLTWLQTGAAHGASLQGC